MPRARKKPVEIETEEHSIIVRVPKTTTKLEIKAWFADESGEKIISATKKFSPEDYRKCRKYFETEVGDEDYDTIYYLTPEGLRELEEKDYDEREC